MFNIIHKFKDQLIIKDPIEYVAKQYRNASFFCSLNKALYILFNLLSAFATFTMITITTIVISKLVVTEYPNWYFYWTTGLTSFLSFLTSLFNFFYIKKNVEKYNKQKNRIFIEITKYINTDKEYKETKDKEFLLFHKVYEILRMTHSLKEKHEK